MKSDDPDQQTLALYTTDASGATVTLTAQKARRHYQERFSTMFVSGIETISRWDRPPTYHRVLFYLLSKLDAVQYRVTSASKIAVDTGMSSVAVSRALSMLTADRIIIERGSKAQRERRLNNQLAWHSTAEKHNQTEADLPIQDARGRA